MTRSSFNVNFGLGMLILGFLVGCDSNSALKGLTDFELAEKNSACVVGKPSAPGKATACENIRKECDRRRKELKTYAC